MLFEIWKALFWARSIQSKIWVGGDVIWYNCPKCGKLAIYFKEDILQAPIFFLGGGKKLETDYNELPEDLLLIFPKIKKPPELIDSLPKDYKEDYREAYNILDISPKAIAALSRRCLQKLLRNETEVKHGSLSNEISQILATLPPDLRLNVDAIRNFGNFTELILTRA